MVVHNGIIANHEPLRALLQSRGYVFVTETDTEVIAHLVHWELEQGGTLREAVLRACLLYTSICGEQLDENGQNLIKVMAENNRLKVLPDVLEQFIHHPTQEIGESVRNNYIYCFLL